MTSSMTSCLSQAGKGQSGCVMTGAHSTGLIFCLLGLRPSHHLSNLKWCHIQNMKIFEVDDGSNVSRLKRKIRSGSVH